MLRMTLRIAFYESVDLKRIDCVRLFFFKQKTAYEMRISDWSSDVCSSDLFPRPDSKPRFEPCQQLLHRSHRRRLPSRLQRRHALEQALARGDDPAERRVEPGAGIPVGDRKSTRLNSSH